MAHSRAPGQATVRSPQELVDALAALHRLEAERPGLKAKLILYTDGEGAMTLEDMRFKKFYAAVDFTETADLLQVVQRLGECENLLED